MLAFLLPLLGPVISKLTGMIPDPEARERAQAEAMASLLAAAQQADQMQANINQTEAASGSIFVAGWRPAVGWVCASALAYQYLARPIVGAGMVAFGHGDMAGTLPALDDSLWELLLGMLGMGGLRTFEKLKGIAAK
jgi:hypothetical protein